MITVDNLELFRRRFRGQNLYGKAKLIQTKEGATRKFYFPVCDNLWSDSCNIKLKNPEGCKSCLAKAYVPVTNESILKHLSGLEEHTIYPLLEDGTCFFMAFDLDNKPGKPEKAYSFEDVKKLIGVLDRLGIPFAVARSSGLGFHVYIWLSRAYSAARARAVALHVLELTGWMEDHRQGRRPIPEIFPKSAMLAQGGIGNGIKCAPVIPRVAEGKNCFVTYENEVITDQWAHLASVPDCDPSVFDRLIEAEKLTIHVATKQHSPQAKAVLAAPSEGLANVFSECDAFNRIKAKIDRGEVLGHQEGFALFFLCLRIQGGVEWFKSNVPGWAKTEKDLHQLEHALQRQYVPMSCRSLQGFGLCPHAGKVNPCLREAPDGKSRSPLAFAYGKKSMKKVAERCERRRQEVTRG